MKPKLKDDKFAMALSPSKTLNVVDGDKVNRKIPFVYTPTEDSDDSDDGIWNDNDKKPKFKPVPAHPAAKFGGVKSVVSQTLRIT